jgi:hypothetical protein
VRKGLLYISILTAFMCVGLAGCGDSANSVNSVPMVVTLRSTAPTPGVSLLSFGIKITNVTLKGGNGLADATIVSNPLTVNLAGLMTSSALLASTSAPAGTYSGVSITFASPQLVLLNNSGASFGDGTKTCASTTSTTSPCVLSPMLAQSTVTVTSGFPLTLVSGSPVDLLLDFNQASSIIGAAGVFTVEPTLTATASSALNAKTNNVADFVNVTGQVTAAANNQLNVTDLTTGQALSLGAGSGTTFSGFNTSSTCTTANTFGCLSTGQIVNFNFGISGMPGAMPQLGNVNLNNGITNGITGTVIGQNSANQNEVLVMSMTPGFQTQNNGLTTGQVVTVNPSNTTTFGVQNSGTTIPAGLNFTGLSNIGVGQSVLLNSTGFTAGVGGAPGTLATNNVTLVPSEFTGTVGSINTSAESFALGGLNGLFGTVPQLTVQTGTTTTFNGVTGFNGLTNGGLATVGGSLFMTPAGGVIVGNSVNGVGAF